MPGSALPPTDHPTDLPAVSRQVIFSARGVIETAEQAVPVLSPGDLLLRVALVGVCATDLHLLAGHIGDPFPLVPGHEFVGEVAAIGASAAAERGLAVGDHVAVEMLLPCRSCARCREGRYNLCEADDPANGFPHGRQLGVNIPRTVAPGMWGGYAEHLFVPAEAVVHRLPETMPWQRAVLVEPLAVACRAIARGRVAPGESVVVIGPGPVGILAAAAARSAGAGRVVVVGTRANRLELARAFGADAVVNSRETDAVAAVREALGGTLADVVIEIAGATAAQEQAVRLVRRGGRVVLAGACGADAPVTFRADEDLLTREIDVLPSFLSAGGFEPAIRLLERGDYDYASLVTHRFGLDEVRTAYDVIESRDGGVLKAVIDPAVGLAAR
ncbi:zinc-dependent alcohol dehydrogenase [Leifsonia naganoensis]|uniref:2-desacetyl-2-hydroxyethyl bacteriochlorophyllide A dehydrogenase n=1 Tax=Leifsonia naganoensis TaxID=150025 RepID=A0A853DS68_9MICO|nr:alcohol dehydrogenase catalytic domain-containing protein [Leifsonia naganoensis]NYK08505.1 2-desacetyl-2-hydroxyethyl bacteriochlorophyllide A dehydrogenase [Leifsonia naganoensis]